MKNKSLNLCKVRTVTAFICLDKDQSKWKEKIVEIAKKLGKITKDIEKKGYIVQTIRMVTNPFGEYLQTDTQKNILSDMQKISDILTDPAMPNIRIRFAIGEAKTQQELLYVPALINNFGDLSNICVNISADELGVPDYEKTLLSAQTIKEIAENTEGGLGNFNFTVNYNCKEYGPYFPAGYHSGKNGEGFVLGFETPDLLLNVVKNISADDFPRNVFLKKAYHEMVEVLQFHVDALLPLVHAFEADSELKFLGIDSSAAPSKECASLVDVFQELGVEHFGAAGSIEVSALLTRVFKAVTGAPLVGFSGLMLAATEDLGLARDAIAGKYDIRTFLTNSAVCGIGLDTVPIEGHTSVEKMAGLMQDTGTMAYRLQKPLTVRIFPVPGKVAGEVTEFESDDLCNCAVFEVK